MNTSPVRQPAFFLLCIAALSGAVAARQHNPVKTLVIEKIQSRYVADRTACQVLTGAQRRDCTAAAELRYDVALTELERLRSEPATAALHRPEAPQTAEIEARSPESPS